MCVQRARKFLSLCVVACLRQLPISSLGIELKQPTGKDRSGFNCSDGIVDALSDHVRLLCDDAIRNAARDERKTVLDRDITRPRR